MEKLTLSVEECAKLLGISRGLAYELARADKLPVPVIKCGKRFLIPRQALEKLLSGDTNTSVDKRDNTHPNPWFSH